MTSIAAEGRERAETIARLNDRARQVMGLPMQPRRAQKPLDIGFWDPMRDQLEMF